jgi:hypothetical protein
MSVANTATVTPGSTIVLDVYFREFTGGYLVDPIPAPTYVIYDPNLNVLASGTGTKTAVGTYTASYAVPLTAVISDSYKIEWTAYVEGFLVPNASELFRVIPVGSIDYGVSINISDLRLNQIKKVLAYPKVSNVLLSDDEIKAFCIEPAMREYFTKFPLVTEYSVDIGYTTEMTIPFPDSYTFGLVDFRVTNTNITSATGGFSNFLNLSAFAQTSIYNRSSYGLKGYNPNFLAQQKLTEQQSLYAMREMNKTIRYKVDTENRRVIIFSNQAGKVYINWAAYSGDFSKIKYQYIEDVIKLSQANLLNHFCDSTDITTNNDLTLTINTDLLKTRADELRTSVMERWELINSVSAIRY